jgi:hypothetical protein
VWLLVEPEADEVKRTQGQENNRPTDDTTDKKWFGEIQKMATGIRDKVAVIGMGCSKFGERWDASPEDLMVESYLEALGDAGIEPSQLDAAWFSTHIDEIGTGKGGTPLSIALRLPNML